MNKMLYAVLDLEDQIYAILPLVYIDRSGIMLWLPT